MQTYHESPSIPGQLIHDQELLGRESSRQLTKDGVDLQVLGAPRRTRFVLVPSGSLCPIKGNLDQPCQSKENSIFIGSMKI